MIWIVMFLLINCQEGRGSSLFGSSHQRANGWHLCGVLRPFLWRKSHLRGKHQPKDSNIQSIFGVLSWWTSDWFQYGLHERLRLRGCMFSQLLLQDSLRFYGWYADRRSREPKREQRSHIKRGRLQDGRLLMVFKLEGTWVNACARFQLLREVYESIRCLFSLTSMSGDDDALLLRTLGHLRLFLRTAFGSANRVRWGEFPSSTMGTLCGTRSWCRRKHGAIGWMRLRICHRSSRVQGEWSRPSGLLVLSTLDEASSIFPFWESLLSVLRPIPFLPEWVWSCQTNWKAGMRVNWSVVFFLLLALNCRRLFRMIGQLRIRMRCSLFFAFLIQRFVFVKVVKEKVIFILLNY